ncbi:hypothetical protein B0J14DRAFT_156097 [Halenospora varia]|nr:hypothetical protein B0J14DRAFT_156097 [Halenospora varia]
MTEQQHFPDRKWQVISVDIVFTVFCTALAIWRLVVRRRIRPRLWLSDYILIGAILLNTAGNAMGIMFAISGQGRLDHDPFLTVEQKRIANRYNFVAAILNVYAMFLIKLSICSYLLYLNFSKSFRIIIWISVFVVVICNFMIPATIHWGQCRPVAFRWDTRVKGSCWPLAVRLACSYTQAGANIGTDLVFAASPLVYIQQIQLPKRTIWGVRFVFLFAIVGTSLSIAKLFDLRRVLTLKENFLHESVSLSILSVAEVGVGIITACLPPLRKTFDELLSKIMPETVWETYFTDGETRTQRSQNYAMPLFAFGSKPSNGTTATTTSDGESQRAIVTEEDVDDTHEVLGKTTLITVENVEMQPPPAATGRKS